MQLLQTLGDQPRVRFVPRFWQHLLAISETYVRIVYDSPWR